MKFAGAVVAALSVISSANAAQVTFHGNAAYRLGNGGEFQARVWSGNAGKTGMASDTGSSVPGGRATPGTGSSAYTSFQTFCLELSEHIDLNPGSPQNPANQVTVSISTAAVGGGVGGGNPDYISPETAFLYTQFRRGVLPDYTYDNNAPVDGLTRAETARALQLAFWKLEHEVATLTVGGANGAGSQAVLDLANAYLALAAASGWTDIGNVRVLNYLRTNGEPGQSVLTIIPLPTAGGLAMAGLLGCGMTRRRFN